MGRGIWEECMCVTCDFASLTSISRWLCLLTDLRERKREREERQTERSVVCVCMHESINVQTCLHSCVRMYAVCMQVCSLHMSACKYSVCIRAYECVWVHASIQYARMHPMRTYTHAYVFVHMRTYIYAWVDASVPYAYAYDWMQVCRMHVRLSTYFCAKKHTLEAHTHQARTHKCANKHW